MGGGIWIKWGLVAAVAVLLDPHPSVGSASSMLALRVLCSSDPPTTLMSLAQTTQDACRRRLLCLRGGASSIESRTLGAVEEDLAGDLNGLQDSSDLPSEGTAVPGGSA